MFMLFHFTGSERFLNAWQLVKRSLHPLVSLVAILSFTVATSAHGGVFLLIDEDSIDNGISTIEEISFGPPRCGRRDPAVCVNDDIAKPGERRLLFTRRKNITPLSGLVLPTGEVGDEGLFTFTNPDLQISLQNGATFTTLEFIEASGAASDENNLDKIDGVVPLSEADIFALEGETVCAVVYDSDISVDIDAGFGSLKGATLGLTAFTVTLVSPDPEGGSYLPLITVDLLASEDVEDSCRNDGPPNGGPPPVG